MSASKCPFTGLGCDGGTVDIHGVVGCAFKESADSKCDWISSLPEGIAPRDFYNQSLMDAATWNATNLTSSSSKEKRR